MYSICIFRYFFKVSSPTLVISQYTLSTKDNSKPEGWPCTCPCKNCPLPNQWTSGPNAGFSEAGEADLWLPIHDHYIALSENVEAHEDAEFSFLKTYRELVEVMRMKVRKLQ